VQGGEGLKGREGGHLGSVEGKEAQFLAGSKRREVCDLGLVHLENTQVGKLPGEFERVDSPEGTKLEKAEVAISGKGLGSDE